MTWPMGLAIFFTTWWVILFAILPIGVQSQHEAGDYQLGTDPSAPVAPRMWTKAAWTTAATVVLFGGIWGLMIYFS